MAHVDWTVDKDSHPASAGAVHDLRLVSTAVSVIALWLAAEKLSHWYYITQGG